MNVDELNQMLFSLTASEERYRAGASYEWKKQLGVDAADAEGARISVSHQKGEPADEVFCRRSRGEAVPGLFVAAGGSIFVRRNSRFNPVPMHTHDYLEMCYVYAGSCVQEINGASIALKEDEVVLLDTGCPHAIAAQGMGDIMVSFMLFDRSFLRSEVLDSLARGNEVSRFLANAFNDEADHKRFVRFSSRGNRRLRRFFQELLCEVYDPSTNVEFITRELFRLIFAELINVYEADYTRHERERGRVSVIPIVHYIEEHFRTCTQQDVADRFAISPKYVSMLLEKHTGMNYRQMVHAQRLARAASLLRTSRLPVTEVAREVGYENMTFFYKKFRAEYGTSPAAYRERYMGANRSLPA